jgi:hypothetical protein
MKDRLKDVPHVYIPYDREKYMEEHWMQQAIEEMQKEHELNKRVIICHEEVEDIYKNLFPGENIIVAPTMPEGTYAIAITDEQAKRDFNMYRMMIEGDWKSE